MQIRDPETNKTSMALGTGGVLQVTGGAIRSTLAVIIPSGASVSGVVDLASTALMGFVMPAAWTPANLRIEVSADNVVWVTSVYNQDEQLTEVIASPVAGAAYAADISAMLPWRYIRFRSGSFGSPVNQAAEPIITCVTHPLA